MPVLPEKNRMLVSGRKAARILQGVDLFLESEAQPDVVAKSLLSVLGDRYTLVTISNRGTQVWPTGSVLTDLVNQYRVRVERTADFFPSQDQLLELSRAVASKFHLCSVEMLLYLDEQPGYSKAQGQ